MNLDDFKKSNSKSFLKLNPALGGLPAQVPEPNRGSEKQDIQLEKGMGRVEVRCELTSYRRRLLDAHDNLAFSFKPLVDRIAADLGVPDNDTRLVWMFYQVQVKSSECEGVFVKISCTRM